MFFRKKISLLPYISEEISNFNSYSPQHQGWEITKFDIPEIWKKSQGENVTVAVIDTGCDLDHPDIRDNLLTNGINLINTKKEPEDDNGHGTHVSSTIAAINNGLGIVGVAPKAKILPIKSLDSTGSGNTKNVSQGIVFAADNGADFITMSLGATNSVPEIKNAVNYAVSRGCIIFCAAGNSGPSVDIMYPAKYSNTISIGAIDKELHRTAFTCSGDSLDFLAPGHDILGCIPGGRYALMSGTSMSNPFAVGCAVLLCSYNKIHKKYNLKNTDDYIKVLSKHTLDLKNREFQNKKYQGYGILNPVALFK